MKKEIIYIEFNSNNLPVSLVYYFFYLYILKNILFGEDSSFLIKCFMKTIFTLAITIAVFFANATVFTVVNTNDSGTGSLREALTYANYYPGTGHSVVFNIPLSDFGYNTVTGVWVIQPLSVMPYITKSGLLVDGTTQTSNQGNTNLYGPEIMLDGNNNSIDFGFFVSNASNVLIKGFIVSNFLYGIQIFGPQTQNCIVSGNYLGTNAAGSDTLGNFVGVEIFGGAKFCTVGGTTSAERNLVSGNEHIGIRVFDATDNIIIGNYVGIDRTGSFAKGNYDGISIEGTAKRNKIGGAASGEGNLVSGNVAYGIPVFGAGCDSNIIMGNIVGLDAGGVYAIPNTYGLLFDDGARYNIVGGLGAGQRNIFSGNSGYGIFLYNLGTCCNDVVGNYIGTNISGTIAVPNANGITIDGVATNHYIGHNVISGNLQQGIVIHITGSDGHIIEKNYIGTDASGTNPLPNGFDGIRLAEGVKNNVIAENIIAHNLSNGVHVMTATDINNKISQNSIYANGTLGIELQPLGVTQNDAGDIDNGPNMLMNFPVVLLCEYEQATGWLHVSGSLDTPSPETCLIELFKSDNDPTSYGEGQIYIGNINADAQGYFDAWLYAGNNIAAGDYLTATATDAQGNTSEFSLNAFVENFVGVPLSKKPLSVFSCYPNPCKNFLTIEYSIIKGEKTEISIYNAEGKKIIILFIGNKTLGNYTETIILQNNELNFIAAGKYFIEFTEGSSSRNIVEFIVF
ncbi:MAG: hypothetical protein A2275_05145 [Bacteroidetes bacterium RIFOXYA12_FULL_35_11]|nr:MAG: hypothetical protein A2X01_15815 [Bacteroidetes bacterium GWF2_35_48]OFY81457.1 MAG: hypothetical protein A2275_05145 [Bacteroidetes bacterium RIFOXYA12_FULL_35_11]OFZ00705.1 MAG: hypothetical protein A2491_14935 [Bacteroidetes bacterium RIFOXYC12_FULL_35_7]HBX50794.1 hypothetical protein [Bacteroidales bacterium]